MKEKNTYSKALIKTIIAYTIFTGIIAAIFLFFFFIQKKINPSTSSQMTTKTAAISTSDWKTYTNDQLGFSAKFPPDWYDNKTKQEYVFLQTSFTTPLRSESTQPDWDTSTNASIQVIKVVPVHEDAYGEGETPGADLSLPMFRQLEQGEKQNGHKQLADVTIAGYPATVYESPSEQTRSIYIESKKFVIILATPYKGAMGRGDDTPGIPFAKYEPIFNQILSTFKFLQ